MNDLITQQTSLSLATLWGMANGQLMRKEENASLSKTILKFSNHSGPNSKNHSCKFLWKLNKFAILKETLRQILLVHVEAFPKHGIHETCHSVRFYFMKKDSKRCCDTTMPESIHTKDESKRGSAFAFIFGVNWPVQWM